MNILLGLTGSVATTLAPKLVTSLKQIGEVQAVATESAKPFLTDPRWAESLTGVYFDKNEWIWKMDHGYREYYQKDDPVLHIALRDWADVFVIAPLSVNTLAKMANGLCDNLLTSIFRAWDWNKPVVVAPAANTMMWESPFTDEHINKLQKLFNNFYVVPPINKMLACKTEGMGAMSDIDTIITEVKNSLRWEFPLMDCRGIPVGDHPGAFGYKRRQSYHTGVDLYVPMDCLYPDVRAMINGVVVGKEAFTGPQDGSDWWLDTDALIIKSGSHAICYGEIKPLSTIKLGQKVKRGQIIGQVIPVLPKGKERPDIKNHSRQMLHIELYTCERDKASTSWKHNEPKHDYLLDPTPYLLDAKNAPDAL